MNGLLRYDDRASDRDWADVLATFPLFAGVGKRQLRKLVRSATFAELARGERVVWHGQGAESLYIVLGGEGEMLRPTRRSFRTGDYFGELGVLGGQQRPVHVVVKHELHLMKLPRQPVLELARRHPPVTLTLLKDLGVGLERALAAGAS
jgi:CRP/FNR family transcriptional regulator, cyclic AMP receptor protein